MTAANSPTIASLPTRERGLKLQTMIFLFSIRLVAPHAGAWIETFYDVESSSGKTVAPHAGAWIETSNKLSVNRGTQSLPTRERGLKHGSGRDLCELHSCSPRGSVD